MSDQIKQIAERLQGLRDVLELTPDEVAKSCQLSVEEYLGINISHWLPVFAGVRLILLL